MAPSSSVWVCVHRCAQCDAAYSRNSIPLSLFLTGSNVQSKEMPPDMLRLFLRVFGSLKQRVLWKFEDESIGQLPPNVMIRKWLPQADILAHRNVKVFITHGGLFGTQEGVHYAVPMLGIPFYCDQVG